MNRETALQTARLNAATWRKSSRSSGTGNGQCVEVACLHDAPWRKSTRSSDTGNGNCVEVAGLVSTVAVRDSKLPTEGNFPHLLVTAEEWTAFLSGIKDH
ncbi:DUF397 domain-containing protein [Glycomyces paridis]|uniref:DUF397 domain-containing protein n=1 Tax=Glycomyces paridis TaxID=2126555 RepID=A0A4S8P6F5_9ACTN|nr:DUF397 domain-containing protein [Glycomyces paridis]THV24412.1 DUF397 domain-containing protein [Glycomyces paridis]